MVKPGTNVPGFLLDASADICQNAAMKIRHDILTTFAVLLLGISFWCVLSVAYKEPEPQSGPTERVKRIQQRRWNRTVAEREERARRRLELEERRRQFEEKQARLLEMSRRAKNSEEH